MLPESPPPGPGPEPADDRRATTRREIDRRVTDVIEGMSDAFLAIGPDWRITYANQEAARLNGVRPDELVGRDHWVVWPETVGNDVEEHYRRVVREHRSAMFEHYYPGAGVWHEIRVHPSDDGGLAVFFHDVTTRKRLEAERAEHAIAMADAHERAMAAEVQFRLLVERVRDYAVFILDPEGIITQWGRGAERAYGYSHAEAIGQHLSFIYPDGGASEDGTAEAHLAHADAYGEYTGEGTRTRRDGVGFPARVVVTALRRGGQLVAYSSIAQDLTDERQREAALAHARAAAEAANVAKSQFLANTSHEIRTPLNAVIGYAELLALGLGGPLAEPQHRFVERIQATSRHLLGLVNDVLDLAKIEAGQMRAAREPALLEPVLAAALEIVEPQARDRRVAVTNVGVPATLAFSGDAERARQIVVNLLSNAVRFTEAEGQVRVSCGLSPQPGEGVAVTEQTAAWTWVRVEDTGIGIAPAQLGRIWEAFEQADSSRTRTVGGSGLGLTISRHLARLMGGDVVVTRSEPGVGSVFELWLPAAELDLVR